MKGVLMLFATARTRAARSKSAIPVVVLALVAMLFSLLASAPSANASPVGEAPAQVVTMAPAPDLVLPQATGYSPLVSWKKECGEWRFWDNIFDAKDKYIRVRVWMYETEKSHTRYYCVQDNRRVKTKKQMGFDVVTYTAKTARYVTKGKVIYKKLKVPKKLLATARPFYGHTGYQTLYFWGYGA